MSNSNERGIIIVCDSVEKHKECSTLCSGGCEMYFLLTAKKVQISLQKFDKKALQGAFPGKEKSLFNDSGLTFAGELAVEILWRRKNHAEGVRLCFDNQSLNKKVNELQRRVNNKEGN